LKAVDFFPFTAFIFLGGASRRRVNTGRFVGGDHFLVRGVVTPSLCRFLGKSGEVLQVDVVDGVQDISADLPVLPVEPLEDLPDLLPLTAVLRGARVDRPGEPLGVVKAADGLRVQEGQGTDHDHLAPEEGLPRQHGSNLRAVEDVDEKGFYEVVEVVTEGDLGAAKPSGLSEEGGPPAARTEEAGIFPILRAVGLRAEGRVLDVPGNSQRRHPLLDRGDVLAFKAQGDMDGHQFVAGGDAMEPVMKEPEKGGAIDPAAEGDENTISLVDEAVPLNSLSDQASHLPSDKGDLGEPIFVHWRC
jgi:hypothetical protein